MAVVVVGVGRGGIAQCNNALSDSITDTIKQFLSSIKEITRSQEWREGDIFSWLIELRGKEKGFFHKLQRNYYRYKKYKDK